MLFALYFTWNLFSGAGVQIPEAVVMQIQKNFVKEAAEIVAQANPDAYDIEVSNFWTKPEGKEKLKAYFTISYKDAEDTFVEKEGEVVLEREKKEKGVEFWRAQDVRLAGQKIEFREALVLNEAGGEDDAENDSDQ